MDSLKLVGMSVVFTDKDIDKADLGLALAVRQILEAAPAATDFSWRWDEMRLDVTGTVKA